MISLGIVGLIAFVGAAPSYVAAASFTVLAPGADTTLTEGSPYVITWQDADIPASASITIEVIRSDGATEIIANNIQANATSYTWTVSTQGFAFGLSTLTNALADLTGAQVAHAAGGLLYQVDVQGLNGTTLLGDARSGEFAIVPASAPVDSTADVSRSGAAALMDELTAEIDSLLAQIKALQNQLLHSIQQ